MIFWQYNASKNPERLAERLPKYKGGQVMLHTKGETLRGEITDYEVSGSRVRFRLRWLAIKRVIRKSKWYKRASWKWEFLHIPTHRLKCAIDVEVGIGEERGLSDDEILHRDVALAKFHQNKEWRFWKFRTNPKCLFFSTTNPGERGVLFQPHDPRNLALIENEVTDPCAPRRQS